MKGKTKKLIKLAGRISDTKTLNGMGSSHRREAVRSNYIGLEALEELERRASSGDSAAVQFIKSRN